MGKVTEILPFIPLSSLIKAIEMTVKQLIIELKKMPQDLAVVTQAHDNSENEIEGYINRVKLIDFSKLTPDETSAGVKKAVVLRS